MPHLETVLPTGIWERFAAQFFRATNVQLALLDSEGRPVLSMRDAKAGCPGYRQGEGGPCSLTYRKAAQQALSSG